MEEQKTLLDDLKDIHGEFGTLAIVIAILTTGVSTFVSDLLQPYYEFWQVLVLNVPMVAAATILAMLVMRRAHAHTSFWEGLWIVAAAIVVPYAIAWLLGLAGAVNPNLETVQAGCSLGRDCPNPGPMARDPGAGALLQYLHPARGLLLVVDILAHYFAPDRLGGTLSALASGFFIAWVFEKKLLPRARRAMRGRPAVPHAGG